MARRSGHGRRRNHCRASRFRIPLQPLQVRAEIRGMLIAKIAILLERFGDDSFEHDRQIGIQARDSRRRAVQNGVRDVRRALATEGRYSCGHLLEYCAETENVRARIQVFPTRLLGRHVRQCAQRRPRPSERGSSSQIRIDGCISSKTQLLNKPEVE